MTRPSGLNDRLGRPLRDLRISVTDRCNFRCNYCMPRDAVNQQSFLPRSELLDFEEVTRIARLFVAEGVRKIRLTGGEPLLRKELSRLVSMLSSLGVEVALTTNGALLPGHAEALKRAGLSRVTVSLDALDESVFQKVCDAPGFTVSDVLAGIDAAKRAGFSPIKINCTVRRGYNEDQVALIARHFASAAHVVRFIEFMDVGTRNAWDPREVFSASEIRARLSEVDELTPLEARYRGEVAQRYEYKTGEGEVGIIASVSQPFCGDCTRARLSADGSLYTCLFAHAGHDLRARLRGGASDEQLLAFIRGFWGTRVDRYSERRAIGEPRALDGATHLKVISPKVEMSFIGG